VLCQKRSFVRSLEIQLTVAGVDFVEEAEIAGNRFGKLAVGGGYKRDAAAGGFFLLDKIKNLLPIGKASRVKVGPGGDMTFERSSARKQPEGKQQQRDGAGLEEDEDALPKDVAPDQSAVEIDAQNWGQHLCGFGSGDRPHE